MRSGTMTNRLIIVNVCVFLSLLLIRKGLLLFNMDPLMSDIWIHQLFDLNSSFSAFIRAPWGLVTSIFTHEQFGHLLFNMLFLYFSGQFFEQYFSRKKLWLTYLFGGIAGGILELLANNLFPALQGTHVVIGWCHFWIIVHSKPAFTEKHFKQIGWTYFSFNCGI